MYSYKVDWKRVLLPPILIGACGISMILTGFFCHWLPAGLGGSIVLWFAVYLFMHRPWAQEDFISLSDTYLLICRRKKEYVLHASDITEIVYGNHIRLNFQKQWFELSCFVQCKQFQNDLVKFAVRNGIFVHASGSQGQVQGKYARLRIVKR